MWKILASTFAFIGSVAAIFLSGKAKGTSGEKQKQQKIENENLQQNIKINKEVGNMSFDDKSDFLLSKQKARDKDS